MNLQLANVLSDVSGATGQAIIKAILAGERNPHKLAEFRDPRVKASEEQIAQSLEGNWQPDLLLLKQEQDGRLRTKLGAPIAIKAMAAKLARLVYRMLRYGMKYVGQGAAFYEAQHKQSQIKQLKWKAAKLGYRVTPIPAAA